MNDYSGLKSGTDIRGRAMGDGEIELTDAAVSDIAAGFALWLSRRVNKPRIKLAVGRDSRLSGERFSQDIIAALKYSGIEIYDCGMFSTPAAFMTTQLPSMQADGAIMITASHHPSDINGLKFFTADGGVNSRELDEIISLANGGEALPRSTVSVVVRRDFMRLYCDTLTEAIRKGTGLFKPLKGIKIAVDAGHGAGGFFALRVLEPLGADISPSQFLEPDGNFPAHAPNPENAAAMDSLKRRVLQTGADLGIIFDADVDRCAIVTSDGTEVNRSRLIALAAAMILPEYHGATIVTDSVTTEALRRFISSKGGVQKRFRRGYRNVIDEAKRLCESGVDAPLAIESSGHVAFSDHYFLDDGAYFAARILIAFANLHRKGQTLNDLIADYEPPLEEADIRLEFSCDDWRHKAETVISRLKGMSERMLKLSGDCYEGVRAYVSYAHGYFILRTSVHDPVIAIYIESDAAGGAARIARLLYSFLRGFSGLDCSPLENYIAQNTAGPRENTERDNYEHAEPVEPAEPEEPEAGGDIAEPIEQDFIAPDEYVEQETDDPTEIYPEQTETPVFEGDAQTDLKDDPDAPQGDDDF